MVVWAGVRCQKTGNLPSPEGFGSASSTFVVVLVLENFPIHEDEDDMVQILPYTLYAISFYFVTRNQH